MGMQLLNEPEHAYWEGSQGIKALYEIMVPKLRGILPANRFALFLSFMDSPHHATAEWLSRMRTQDPHSFAGVVYDKHLYHLFGDNQAPWTAEMDHCKTCCRDPHILRQITTAGV